MMTANPPAGASPARSLPWGSFFFLIVLFWFGSRADLFFSVEDPFVVPGLVGARSSDWTKGAALVVFAIWSVFILLRGRRFAFRITRTQAGCLIAYLASCFISLLWSDAAALTLRTLVPLAISCLGALAIACRFSIDEVATLTFLNCSATAAIGCAAEVVLGTFHPWSSEYRFTGLWHPNTQGINLSVAVLSGLFLARRTQSHPVAMRAVLCFDFLLLVLTRSRTALASVVVSVLLTWLLMTTRRRRALFGFSAALILSFLMLLSTTGLAHWSGDAFLLGREDGDATTLTNRVPLWQEIFKYVEERPLLGFGYGAFWTPQRIVAVSTPWEAAWIPPSEQNIPENAYLGAAHNMFLEAALDGGVVGVILFSAMLFTGLQTLVARAVRSQSLAWAYGFSVLVFLVLDMMLEALSFQPFMPLLIGPVFLMKTSFVREPDERRIQPQNAGGPETPRRLKETLHA